MKSSNINIPKVGDNDVLAEVHEASIYQVDSKINIGYFKLILA
ncbi:NADPH:quinone reductase-like Zn-dependent oxidoreductase [Flavobacterium gossypii]|uniref:NADPH:quinone reductase-like Zn-dependent oxidoreductase n=1 Tax=Flavobacterium gossypii TaxID=1646119 RepID=A0ABR6DRC6_9FLAO|nr:hypothetical protein [Flavobacterium gossypii]MBA9074227.1 NADPH:quinone reductase-like Zn-dependent oxidoreductase [Flavobacterium gossypii]